MKPNQVREDMEQWLPLIGWLAQRRPLDIPAGTPAITSAASVNSLPMMAPATPAVTSPAAAAIAAGVSTSTPAEQRLAPAPPTTPEVG
jgi:hypothetical protein